MAGWRDTESERKQTRGENVEGSGEGADGAPVGGYSMMGSYWGRKRVRDTQVNTSFTWWGVGAGGVGSPSISFAGAWNGRRASPWANNPATFNHARQVGARGHPAGEGLWLWGRLWVLEPAQQGQGCGSG